jgi:hypothetical protein
MVAIRPYAVLFKFVMSEDCQAALRRCKVLARTKLGLDKDLTLAQQAHKSKLWSLFKEAKATCTTKLFIDITHICPPSSI